MSRRVAVITRDRDRCREALRTGLGLLLERHRLTLFVVGHEVDSNEDCLEYLSLIDEMGGDRYSSHPENVAKHGFRSASLQETGRLLAEHDLVIPF